MGPRCDPADQGFSLNDWPLYWITRVSRQYAMDLDRALKRVGMDVGRWRVLMILNQFGVSSVSTLADHAVIKLPTMTKTVLRMEAEGLVSTSQDPSDRRVTLVSITPMGAEATAIVRLQASRLFHTAFVGVDQDDADNIVQTLRRIYANLTNEPL